MRACEWFPPAAIAVIFWDDAAITVTVHVAVLLPAWVVTVIIAVPTALPVTVPLLTVATLVLLLDQFTVLFVALLGVTVAVSVSVPPTEMLVDALFRLTPLTDTHCAS